MNDKHIIVQALERAEQFTGTRTSVPPASITTLDQMVVELNKAHITFEFVIYVQMVNAVNLCPMTSQLGSDIKITNILQGYLYWHLVIELFGYCVRHFNFPVPGMSNTDAVGVGGVSSCSKVCHVAAEQKARMAQACQARGIAVPELEKWFFLTAGKAVVNVSHGPPTPGAVNGEEDEDGESEFLGEDGVDDEG